MSITCSVYFAPTGSVNHYYEIQPQFYGIMVWHPELTSGSVSVPTVGQLWPRGNFSNR